jgi:hypothetical protein
MSIAQFNREEMARCYAHRHLATDRAIRSVYYLPAGAPEREIRFLEINELMAVRDNDPLEPIDFGVDIGSVDSHTLLVLDVTPTQWDLIRRGEVLLPPGWSLDGAVDFSRPAA